MTRAWFLFVLAMDSLCRTIGTSDMYPFVLTRPVIGKLAFISRAGSARAVGITAGSGGG
ncbi:putative zinc-binding metallopeptidase [Bradyrhizobium icense]|uniref:putative zinc-binding metallopeptidase n=1 Tax=Bradyrhizobium icense TaxID=1274631 RepID=UPI0018D37A2F|nr:putative zinc-binding metallopeptidase [Bradyrhizobium icense]